MKKKHLIPIVSTLSETRYLVFYTYSLIFGFKYSFFSIGQGKSSAVWCGPSISLEMEVNYPYLHSFMFIELFIVDHWSTGLSECGPTESSAPEPCSIYSLRVMEGLPNTCLNILMKVFQIPRKPFLVPILWYDCF